MAKRICVFGDSVAWGACLPKREAWTDLLRNYLDEKSQYSVELYNLGIDRDMSKDILLRIDAEANARKPHITIFAVGTNDSIYRANNQFDISESEFVENLKSLVGKARKFTEKLWFVGLAKGSDQDTVPLIRSSTGKCYSKVAVKRYDECLKKFTASENIPFVDIFSKLDDSDFDDGLHPNIEGHRKIFTEIKTMFEKQGIMDFLLS